MSFLLPLALLFIMLTKRIQWSKLFRLDSPSRDVTKTKAVGSIWLCSHYDLSVITSFDQIKGNQGDLATITFWSRAPTSWTLFLQGKPWKWMKASQYLSMWSFGNWRNWYVWNVNYTLEQKHVLSPIFIKHLNAKKLSHSCQIKHTQMGP